MDVETAPALVKTYVARMHAAYGQPVFDEWAILGVSGGTGSVIAYEGPRAEIFRRSVAKDSEPLRARTAGRPLADGDLEFVSDAHGTQYDAFMKLGATSYLVLNHTGKTLTQIRTDPNWIAAQPVLFELSEKFREDPLSL